MASKTLKSEFTGAYIELKPKIASHLHYRVRSSEVDDLLQETFSRTWQYLVDNDGNIDDIKSFVYMVANNLIIDYYRQKHKIPISIESIDEKYFSYDSGAAEAVDIKLKEKAIRHFMVQLDENHRRVIKYRYFEHLSIDEICQRTGKSPNYVSVLIYQATKKLRQFVGRSRRVPA